MKPTKLTYAPKLYRSWKGGLLHEKWFRRHPGVFDEDDLRLARTQRKYGIHFGEWFTAIHYAKRGYGVLVEKYIYGNHRCKRRVILAILGERGLRQLRKWRKRYHCQPPDLLVYRGRTCFFVEVKRGRDSVRDSQRRLFKKIESTLGRRVVIVDLQATR